MNTHKKFNSLQNFQETALTGRMKTLFDFKRFLEAEFYGRR